ncbi:hypothetical protein QOT17_021723 [Balamuthia mandrillaris]
MEPGLEALGRTRLRVELRRRELSCNGLKHELQARLRDYFAGGGCTLQEPASCSPPTSVVCRGPRAAPRGKKGEQPQEEVHQAPKRQRRKRKNDPIGNEEEEEEEEEELSKAKQKRRKKANTTYTKVNNKNSTQKKKKGLTNRRTNKKKTADNRTQTQQKKKAFTSRRTNKKKTDTKEEEEEQAPEGKTNEEQDVQKEVLCFTPSQSEASDDEGEEDEGSNVLEGCTFVNEVQHQRNEQQALRSVEHFVFQQNSFSFIYKCWRGEELIHNAEIHGGTFHFTRAPFTPSKPTQERPTESNSGDTETHNNTEQTKEEQAKEKLNEKEEHGEMSNLQEKERQSSHGAPTWTKKVVLHWPSSALQPALKTLPFQRTYPCFYLLKISVDHAGWKEGPLALRSRLLVAASLPVPSTVSPSSSSSSLILVSRQNAVFMPDSSKPEKLT